MGPFPFSSVSLGHLGDGKVRGNNGPAKWARRLTPTGQVESGERIKEAVVMSRFGQQPRYLVGSADRPDRSAPQLERSLWLTRPRLPISSF